MSTMHSYLFETNSWQHLKAFFNRAPYSCYVVLVDENTEKHCLPILQEVMKETNISYSVVCLPPGESSKTIQACQKIWETLANLEADRAALLINLGGGLITDLGGFAASVYKRGIDFINLPTSLLGMIDAAVGGKTGLNFQRFKNQIGTFCFAKASFIYPEFLTSLDEEQLKSGFAEAIKHALIEDELYFEELSELLYKRKWWSKELIERSIQIKTSIVEKDPYERGERKKLNFGHTVGHAVETYFIDKEEAIPHGMAIAIGMICETYLSGKLSGLNKEAANRLVKLIRTHYTLPGFSEHAIDEIMTAMRQDKKRANETHRLVLLTAIGECIIDQEVSEEDIRESLKFYLQ